MTSKRRIQFMAPLLSLSLLSACGPKIPIVGLDENNEPTVIYENGTKTSEELVTVAQRGQSSVLQALSKAEHLPKKPGFKIHTVLVGIGFSAEIGVGPIGIGAEPKIRFVFSDRQKSTLP